MFALLTKRGGGKGALGGLGPLIEEIGIGSKREIGVRILLEARAQLRPLQMLGRRLEGEGAQLRGRPEIELCAGLIPTLGMRRTISRGFGWSVLASSQVRNR